MLEEIVKQNEKRISEDIKCINGIVKIDFIDIFPKSEGHKKLLDKEISQISKLIDSTEKGNFYLLNTPINTKWGKLEFLKVRFFDESRLNYEAAPDFEVENWYELKKFSQTNDKFRFIEREIWNAIEYKTDNCLVCFLNPLVSKVYNIEELK